MRSKRRPTCNRRPWRRWATSSAASTAVIRPPVRAPPRRSRGADLGPAARRKRAQPRARPSRRPSRPPANPTPAVTRAATMLAAPAPRVMPGTPVAAPVTPGPAILPATPANCWPDQGGRAYGQQSARQSQRLDRGAGAADAAQRPDRLAVAGHAAGPGLSAAPPGAGGRRRPLAAAGAAEHQRNGWLREPARDAWADRRPQPDARQCAGHRRTLAGA